MISEGKKMDKNIVKTPVRWVRPDGTCGEEETFLLSETRYSSLKKMFPDKADKLFEINEAYASEIAAMLDRMGYTDIQITKDIYGKDRIIEGRMA